MLKLLHERPRSFYPAFDRKDGDPTVTHYCPGCGHGNVHKLVAEAVDDLGIADRMVFINPVGCSVFAYYYLDVGHIQAPHGRAPAVATAVKRARPDSIVIVYQGDGDLAAIGGNEILQAAARGEDLTVIFINNALYGMTGGQLAPTSLVGQITSTTPRGRAPEQEGYPIKVCELLGSLDAPVYLERVALGDGRHDLQVRRAVRKAIKNQMEGKGFSLVEVLSPCPTGWKQEPPDSARWVLETMTKTFPLGVKRDVRVEGRKPTGARRRVEPVDVPKVLGLDAAQAVPGGTHDGWSAEAIEPRFRNPRIKVAGFGGQGVLFLGTVIAEAGMLSGRAVSWLPSYGPEMRGGTAHCHVILSEHEVDSPLVSEASVLFAFNRPSLMKFAEDVGPQGLIIYDSGLIQDPPPLSDREVLAVPATSIAEHLGSARAANLVALGAWIGRTGILPVWAVRAALQQHALKPGALELNLNALEEGIRQATPALRGGAS
ncbi:MAG TPA: 2-oxoacid:acceptor oxidoreductase family protein [Candidatus Polarisedimenticolia bacterium]|nr:2-oxoacid:acceptor oxidoreductase family protein [Candidatus Polarisedimenticolia bacterium]